MLRAIPLFLAFVASLSSSAQKDSVRRFTFGIEQDVLPYITGGYFAGAWAGRNHLRFRTITAKVHKPDFIVEDGFTNNTVVAYAMLADFFPKQDWKGWWLGTGLVYWQSNIQSEKK